MPSWPSTLPDFTLHTITGGFGEGRSVTPSDSGRMQVRRISGAPPFDVSVQHDYTGSQCEELSTFYYITLEGGILAFDHINLWNGGSSSYQFKPNSPPPQFNHKISARRAGPRGEWMWTVEFTLLWLT